MTNERLHADAKAGAFRLRLFEFTFSLRLVVHCRPSAGCIAGFLLFRSLRHECFVVSNRPAIEAAFLQRACVTLVVANAGLADRTYSPWLRRNFGPLRSSLLTMARLPRRHCWPTCRLGYSDPRDADLDDDFLIGIEASHVRAISVAG